jgi:deazaflavin-dependent oxidoreductase (nitroreductase family)
MNSCGAPRCVALSSTRPVPRRDPGGGVLAIGRLISPAQRRLYRSTGGRLSLTGRAPVLLLTTTGRRTGIERTVPLLYLRDGDRLVVCNVNPGFERTNPWVLNLRAHPRARVQWAATPSPLSRARPPLTKSTATGHG